MLVRRRVNPPPPPNSVLLGLPNSRWFPFIHLGEERQGAEESFLSQETIHGRSRGQDRTKNLLLENLMGLAT